MSLRTPWEGKRCAEPAHIGGGTRLRGDSEPRVEENRVSNTEFWAVATDPATVLLGSVYGHSSSKSEMCCGEREEWAERNAR